MSTPVSTHLLFLYLTAYRTHIQVVFHTFNDFTGMPIVGIVVPQSVYPAPQQYNQRPTVRFCVNNTLGIRLVDALANNFNGLAHAATIPVLTDANRISCRIQVR